VCSVGDDNKWPMGDGSARQCNAYMVMAVGCLSEAASGIGSGPWCCCRLCVNIVFSDVTEIFFINYGRPAQQDDSLAKDRFSSIGVVKDINT
jgi:hypothetical protein